MKKKDEDCCVRSSSLHLFSCMLKENKVRRTPALPINFPTHHKENIMKNLMNTQPADGKQLIVRNFKKNIIVLSALVLGCSFFTVPAHASGDEGRERHMVESKLYGVIDKMPENGLNGTWIINGKTVVVSDRTRIKEKYDRAVPGRYVEVEGLRDGDSITAYEIEVERSREGRFDDRRIGSKFYGTVETLPQTGLDGVWKIDGRDVVVTPDTRIKEKYSRLAVGSIVEVEGRLSDNTFTAYEIEVKNRRR
ncbi:MAG: hypothetical protein D3914_09230 [Candidatus Electrothrix sp. LOE2]|nr:hypothetical protein [Candidatus Electrothrix sp. LOE2]